MRVLHCCLAAFYIDDFSYQENILPKMHKLQGHEVAILASTESYVGTKLGYVEAGSYLNKDGIKVTRIPYVNWLPLSVGKKLRIYEGVLRNVKDFNPDIIFLHDCQFISIKEIVSFAKKNKEVRIYVDGHTDFINSAKGFVSKNILHKIIYKWCVQKIEPFTSKFYGTLPARVDFFKDVYGTPPEKTELLLLGVDDTQIDFSKKEEIRSRVRTELNLRESDFVMVTGGKLDRRKNIHILMKAVGDLNIGNIKLIVFGTPNDEMKEEIEALTKSPNICYVGWIPSDKTNDYFFASDLGFFPGTHSVLWEQAVGLGLPCVFKKWEGIQHIDLGGNCLLLNTSGEEEIKECISRIYQDKNLLTSMKKAAIEKGIPKFSFYEIARRAIEQ